MTTHIKIDTPFFRRFFFLTNWQRIKIWRPAAPLSPSSYNKSVQILEGQFVIKCQPFNNKQLTSRLPHWLVCKQFKFEECQSWRLFWLWPCFCCEVSSFPSQMERGKEKHTELLAAALHIIPSDTAPERTAFQDTTRWAQRKPRGSRCAQAKDLSTFTHDSQHLHIVHSNTCNSGREGVQVMLLYEGFGLIQSFYLYQDKNYFIDFIPEKQNQGAFTHP